MLLPKDLWLYAKSQLDNWYNIHFYLFAPSTHEIEFFEDA